MTVAVGPDTPPSRGNPAAGRRRAAVQKAGTVLAYLYVLRVPLLICALVSALPFIALPRDAVAGSLLRGLFDVADPDPARPAWTLVVTFGLLTLTALFLAAAITVTARLILLDGRDRFNLDRVPSSSGLQLLLRLIPLLAVVLLLGGAWIQSWGNIRYKAAAVNGTLLAIGLFAVLMTVVHERLWRAVFVKKLSFLSTNNPIVLVTDFLFAALRRIVRLTPAGFVDATGRMWARHAFAVLQVVLSFVFYIALFVLKMNWIYIGAGQPRIPTLCLVLVLGMLACWALTGLTFLLDRFRVPLLSALVAYGTVMSVFPWNDHFFQTVNRPAPQAGLGADAVLKQRSERPAIVIAAAGGGIQAAAWTARVIDGLQRDSASCRGDFDEALVAVSAVSGGSVGAMYIVDAYAGGRIDAAAAATGVKAAEASSLDDVAWGLTYPDLVWTVAPFLKPLYPPFLVRDRGSALENAWKRSDSLTRATLDGWRADVAAQPRVRPAVLFNATVSESGERMLFATTTLGPPPPNGGRREFARDFPDRDVPVTTAARLSATFPYVSPAARVDRHAGLDDQYHYVDGGYYDNYGTATMIEWLDDGLSRLGTAMPSRVLLIEIRSFPNADPASPNGARGWTADTLQPLTTLYAVRGAGQDAHSRLNVHLLEDDYGGELIHHVQIVFPARILEDQDDAAPPLSWHLTPADRGRLLDAWDNDPDVRQARLRVLDFLGENDGTPRAACIAR
jgi:hypothetical protein